ncbi:TetR/AcrR family transcriptional regulator [Paracoccus yeei]|nr:TetR/AcrR family transcriptional regulator [Paracoccus yeei]
MGRKRSIDRDELMRAVDAVARLAGVSGLSIDAVAKEAGVSKSSVVYDCQGKAGLLAEFTRSQIAQFHDRVEDALNRRQGQSNAFLRALIDEFRTAPTDDDIAITMLISASMGENAECREIMQQALSADARRIAAEAAEPRQMLRVLLTLHGMMFVECFGFHRFDEVTRNEILDDLMALAERDPGADLTEKPSSD